MLVLAPPQITMDSISTQIRHKIEYVHISSSSTKLFPEFWKDEKTFDFNSFLGPKTTATQFEIRENYISSNSTWEDSIVEDFDIVSKFTYGASFKVKAKIISVSRFAPKIIIE